MVTGKSAGSVKAALLELKDDRVDLRSKLEMEAFAVSQHSQFTGLKSVEEFSFHLKEPELVELSDLTTRTIKRPSKLNKKINNKNLIYYKLECKSILKLEKIN